MNELPHIDYASILSHVLYYENTMLSKYIKRKLNIKELTVSDLNTMHTHPIKYSKEDTVEYNYSHLIELASLKPVFTYPVFVDDVPMLEICERYRTPNVLGAYMANELNVLQAERHIQTVREGYIPVYDYHFARQHMSLHSFVYANYGTDSYALHIGRETYEQ